MVDINKIEFKMEEGNLNLYIDKAWVVDIDRELPKNISEAFHSAVFGKPQTMDEFIESMGEVA